MNKSIIKAGGRCARLMANCHVLIAVGACIGPGLHRGDGSTANTAARNNQILPAATNSRVRFKVDNNALLYPLSLSIQACSACSSGPPASFPRKPV